MVFVSTVLTALMNPIISLVSGLDLTGIMTHISYALMNLIFGDLRSLEGNFKHVVGKVVGCDLDPFGIESRLNAVLAHVANTSYFKADGLHFLSLGAKAEQERNKEE